jgi:uncharacterized protein
MIPIDTSVVYALLDRADQRHHAAATWYRREEPEVITTPLVVAEVDQLVLARAGSAAAAAWRADLAGGAYAVDWWDSAVTDVVAIAEQYADLGLGLTDASLIALAARVGTTGIATFDERHFRAVRPLAGGDAFRLLPLDALQ